MTYQPQPTKVKGGQTEVRAADEDTQQLLERILIALNQINIQLALMTDNVIDEGEQL